MTFHKTSQWMVRQGYGEVKSMSFELQATTPLDPRVLDAMLPFMTDQYGNPHSRTHFFGWETEDAVEVARKEVGTNPPDLSMHRAPCAEGQLLP